jgi:hypothetical protein
MTVSDLLTINGDHLLDGEQICGFSEEQFYAKH